MNLYIFNKAFSVFSLMLFDLAMIIIKVAVRSWEGLLHCKQDQFKSGVHCCSVISSFFILA